MKTADGNKFLPIWIGHPEAAAILMKLQSQAAPRPMTHDLLSDMLEQLDAQITRITVTELRENTFYAQITVQQDGREIEVDSRPSDAIALAIRAEAPIFAADRVIEESAIEFEGEDVDPRAARGRGAEVQALPRRRHARGLRRRERRGRLRGRTRMSDGAARPRYAVHRRVLSRLDSGRYRGSLRPCAALAYRARSTSVIRFDL